MYTKNKLVYRVRVISLLSILIAVGLIARLYQIQIINSDFYANEAKKQYSQVKNGLFSRGSIFFSNQDGSLLSAATVKEGYVLAVNPKELELSEKEVCYQLKSFLQDIDLKKCQQKISDKNRTYVELNNQVTKDKYQAISDLKLKGVNLYDTRWRYYPGKSLAAQTIGFIGYTDKDANLRGKYGLERYYDDILFRQEKFYSVNYFAELFGSDDIKTKKEKIDNLNKDNKNKGDIVLSLEPSVSKFLSEVLKKTNDKYNSKVTGAIIMNPSNGEVVAMDLYPGFDLNNRNGVGIERFKNLLVENVYEFGSIVKALTMAAGLDSGAVTADTTYYDAGHIRLNGSTISNYDGRGRGVVPMQEVLNQSLNTGVSYVVKKMGRDKFRNYFLNYKLGSETGIDLPNEVFGLVDNLYSPRDLEYATASFGQGIATTPIAIIRALSVLANGGYLVTPHLVKQIRYQDGSVKDITYPKGKQVISKESSEEISRMLTVVVDKALRGGRVKFKHYSVAAKTGTAQIPDTVNGGYYKDRYLHSFFGYFPSYNPKFIIFIYTVEPKGVRYASETLTTPFINLVKFLINYYNVVPDR